MNGYFLLKESAMGLKLLGSRELNARSLPSFFALATISPRLGSKINPFASASCLAFIKAGLGAAAPKTCDERIHEPSKMKTAKRMMRMTFLALILNVYFCDFSRKEPCKGLKSSQPGLACLGAFSTNPC